MNNVTPKVILLVADDLVLVSYSKILHQIGHKIITANSKDTAVEITAGNEEISLILIDIDLGRGNDGPETAKQILKQIKIPIIFLVSNSGKNFFGKVQDITSYGYVLKGSGQVILKSSIELALKHFEANMKLDLRTKALRVSAERLRLIADTIEEVFWMADVDINKMSYISPGYEKIWGRSRQSLVDAPKSFLEAIHPEDLQRVLSNLEVQKIGLPFDHQYRIFRPDGSIRWIWDRGFPIPSGKVKVTHYAGVACDITKQKFTEEALRKSEVKYRLLFEGSRQGILTVDIETRRFVDANPSICRMFRYSKSELLQLGIEDLHPKELLGHVISEFTSQVKGEKEMASIIPCLRKDGTIFFADISSALHTIYGRKCAVGFFSDVTVRKQAEEAVRKNEQRLSFLLTNNPAVIYSCRNFPDFEMIFISDNVKTILGYRPEEVINDPCFLKNHIHPEDTDRVFAGMQGLVAADIGVFEYRLLRKDGQYIWVHNKIRLVSSLNEKEYELTGYLSDITYRKQLEADKEQEAKKRQVQKEESLARMAGSIAHIFNNQLGVVIGYLELAKATLNQETALPKYLGEAMEATQRAADVSGMMLTYLGHTIEQVAPLDLSAVIRQSLPAVNASISKDIVLITDLPDNGPIIEAHSGEIQMILNKLMINASEAMDSNQRSIHLRVTTALARDLKIMNCFPPGWRLQDNVYACLEITDTGCGIEPGNIEKIFDPFFSTKFTGRGMGLSVTLGVIRAYGGAIMVESEPGRGSVFRLFFPITSKKLPTRSEESLTVSFIQEDGAILVAEKDELMMEIAKTMLEHLGFTVLEAKSGDQALEMFHYHRNKICCVLCNFPMPVLDGGETISRLRQLAPEIPAVLISSHDKYEALAGDLTEKGFVFLAKQYTLKDLSKAISSALKNKKVKGIND